jgi:hypothetical protein
MFGTASQLVFSAQPGGGQDGTAWTTQPKVTVEDQSGNVVTNYATGITLAIASQPGSGAALGCTTNPLTPTNGVATFAGCEITGKLGSYTLKATSGALSVTSNAFSITLGNATQLAFTTEPGNGGGTGQAFSTPPVVSIEDSGGNVVTTATNSITLAIGTNPTGRGATLVCVPASPLTATNGVATFTSCNITHRGGTIAGWTLQATANGLTSATSTTFTT